MKAPINDGAGEESAVGPTAQNDDSISPSNRRRGRRQLVLLAVCAFGVYWASSAILDLRKANALFGADTWHYTLLAGRSVAGAGDYELERITRFHLTTVAAGLAWMKVLAPLGSWIAPQHLLRAMFAAIGAAGVCVSVSALAAIIPRNCAVLFGLIYATSFGIWYFSSIEESKIVTATLTALYIAVYLRLREKWANPKAALLTAILLLACLNEIVAIFLVVIPVVDALVHRWMGWNRLGWIATQALVGPLTFLILDGFIASRQAPSTYNEGASLVRMFFHYIFVNDYSVASLYSFVLNWYLFNIIAPTTATSYAPPAWPYHRGYFEPAFANYFSSPVTAILITLLFAMIVAAASSRIRSGGRSGLDGMMLALAAYVLIRAGFFVIFNPSEPLIFSPAVTLAHLMLIAIPLGASRLPWQQPLLAGFAFLLFVSNGAFIIGW